MNWVETMKLSGKQGNHLFGCHIRNPDQSFSKVKILKSQQTISIDPNSWNKWDNLIVTEDSIISRLKEKLLCKGFEKLCEINIFMTAISEYNSVACKKIKGSEVVLQPNHQSIATSTENLGELLCSEQRLARFGCLHHCFQQKECLLYQNR